MRRTPLYPQSSGWDVCPSSVGRAGIFLFDGPGGGMGIDFFWRRWDLFFARQRGKKIWYFFGIIFVFLLFFGGVFVLVWCFFLFFARSANFFLAFFFRGDFFFSRSREQNVKFPLCRWAG